MGRQSGGAETSKDCAEQIKEARNFMSSGRTLQNVNVMPCAGTNANIVAYNVHHSSTLHTGRNTENVAKPAIFR